MHHGRMSNLNKGLSSPTFLISKMVRLVWCTLYQIHMDIRSLIRVFVVLVLLLGDFSITESGAIHRYCAKKWCPELLHLDDAKMYARAEMLWGVVSDAKGFVTMQCYRGDGTKGILAWKATDRLELLAKAVNENKYLAGDVLCCADFAFVELVEMVEFISDGKVFEKYPALKTYRDGIFELPGLKEYIQKRAHLPFNNKVAKINN